MIEGLIAELAQGVFHTRHLHPFGLVLAGNGNRPADCVFTISGSVTLRIPYFRYIRFVTAPRYLNY